jgi:hypothetical protein
MWGDKVYKIIGKALTNLKKLQGEINGLEAGSAFLTVSSMTFIGN